MKDNDRYQVLEELGRGSFGTVYRGIERATGETVALKQIDLEASDDDIQEIQQEISVLSTCASSFVVQYKESFLDRTDLWIVMEYLGGGSCLDLLKPGNFSEGHIAILCRELLLGLEYLHAEGKIHRDIKAANVLLSETGKVKLADFGVAAQLTNITSQRNTFVGTPYWMAPEVIDQSGYDFKADIWSLGITAMELARGEPPHAEIHPMKVLLQIPKFPPPRLEGDFSKDFKNFVAQCLMKEPDLRPSARELLKHRFIRSAGKVEALQELIQRRQMWDASKNRVKHPVFYQETLRTMAPKDESDAWVFDTVKSVSLTPNKKTTVRSRKASGVTTVEDAMRKLDVKDGPLQPTTPGTVRKSTMRRQPSAAQQQQQQQQRRRESSVSSSLGFSNDSPRGSVVIKRPLQPDMSFGNSGSSMHLFRRVPSDSSSSTGGGGGNGYLDTPPELFGGNENRPPSGLMGMGMSMSIGAPVEPNSKEALLGRRLYGKALEPALAELHAQTAASAKRDALARLSDAFALLDAVDPEGAYHLMHNLVAAVAQDTRLNAAILQPNSLALPSAKPAPAPAPAPVPAPSPAEEEIPLGTVLIKSQQQAQAQAQAPAPPSPSKLVLSAANPHLKSHRRRQNSVAPEPAADLVQSPRRGGAGAGDTEREKAAFEAKLPGRESPPGMEHVKQISDVLYDRWTEGLWRRWGKAKTAAAAAAAGA